MRRPWLFKGDAINKELVPGVEVLAGRGQMSENLQETAEDFCRNSTWTEK